MDDSQKIRKPFTLVYRLCSYCAQSFVARADDKDDLVCPICLARGIPNPASMRAMSNRISRMATKVRLIRRDLKDIKRSIEAIAESGST